MYFGHVFGWNVVTRSLNAAINNTPVIFILKRLNKNLINNANNKPTSKKK